MNIAFAGLRHDHIFMLYNEAKHNPMYNIAGAFESDLAAKKRAEDVYDVDCNYSSYEELLSDSSIEVVALGGCFAERGEMAIKALCAGKHVIADKPLCTKLSELDEIEKLAKETGKKVSCMYAMRFEKTVNALKKLAENGTLGEINAVTFGGQHPLMYGRRPDWYYEDGRHGGVITDIAIHGIDILRYALSLRLDNVNGARCWNRYATEHKNFKDSAQLMLTMDNGAGIIGDVSYAIPDGIEFGLPYYWSFYVWGTKGVIHFNLHANDMECYIAGNATPLKLELPEIRTEYLTDFYRMVNGEKDVILPMNEVFSSMRDTLTIQQYADRCGVLLTQEKREISGILDYIGKNYKENITVQQISEDFFISRNALNKKFRQYLGITLREYILRFRIEKANELIEGGKSVNEAAYESGFRSIRTFNNAYRANMGFTPTEYMKNM